MSPPTLSNPTRVTWDGQPAFWKGFACHQTPDDLFNFAELVHQVHPWMIVEVGPGDGGTALFLGAVCQSVVLSVDKGDPVPMTQPRTLAILDGDVYDRPSVSKDLETYILNAQWIVVCHTNRDDWGAAPALADWLPQHPEWSVMTVRHPTQHTWLTRT